MTRLAYCGPFADPAIDELFRGFLMPVRAGKTPAPIRLDVTEKDDAYVVRAEIPGVAKDDIEVSIEGSQVTIGAKAKGAAEPAEGERVLLRERREGSTFRSFTLPAELDEAASTARYDNGVLVLTLAKKAAPAGRRLTIQ